MKITLNELRQIISTNLLTEALNFEAMEAQNPPYYQKFKEIFDKACFKFQLMLGQNDKKGRGMKINTNWNMIDTIFSAYLQYMLICVIEKGMPYAPINYVDNQSTNLDNFDINNPTGGIKGKFTEFIVKVLASSNWGLNVREEGEEKLYSFKILNEFIGICEKSSSNLYKSKMRFFDTIIMPFLDDKIAAGKIRNFPRPSPQSPLQDKVAKVFDVVGKIQGKNLIEIILDEVLPSETVLEGDENIKTFAGYDIKLIDFCLQHNYWQEINLPDQSDNYRIFFISNNSSKEDDVITDVGIDKYDYYAEWENKVDWGDIHDTVYLRQLDYDDYVAELFNEAWENKKIELMSDRVDIEFSYRAMIYANNIYPFKTPYNTSKKTVKGVDVAYFKSIKEDDYLVPEDNEIFKIRKTTDWCTKDKESFSKYWYGGDGMHLINGYLLILNNALPYNDPNGAALIGLIRNETKIPGIDEKYEFYQTIHELNAKDKQYKLPEFVNEFCGQRKLQEAQQDTMDVQELSVTLNNFEEFKQIINQNQNQYKLLSKIKSTDYLKNIESGEQSHQILQRLLNQTNKIHENSYKLLSSYIRYILT